ncbi:MAG: DUF6316 family protein [Achromobacter sp.]|nr:DUF6316 family protein [Achromobacter sp.]
MSRSRFRDQRVFHIYDPAGEAAGWYFEVREGPPHGPYRTRELAVAALADYLNEHKQSSRREDDGDDAGGTDAKR